MPEVVVATPDAEGKPRKWNDVFPILNNDDDSTEWRVINEILEAVAMFNRFGCDKKCEDLQAHKSHMLRIYQDWLREQLGTPEPHDHKVEFPEGTHNSWGCTKECEALIPPERMKIIEERAKLFKSYGWWTYYINEVIDNVSYAYRQYK